VRIKKTESKADDVRTSNPIVGELPSFIFPLGNFIFHIHSLGVSDISGSGFFSRQFGSRFEVLERDSKEEQRMRKLSWKLLGLMLLLLLIPAQVFAAGGGGAGIVMVADTRKFSGLEAWWGNLYNEGHALFTLVTCIIIPVLGCALGLLADFVMARLGIDLKKRVLAEH
jgi:hypothetical protein